MDVKEMTVMDFYNFYIDFKECEEVINNYFKRTSFFEEKNKSIKKSVAEDDCPVCYERKIKKRFECSVNDI